MAKIEFIEPGGQSVTLAIPDGWTFMQGATTNGVEGTEAECGGSCACATCHCYVETLADRLPEPSATELDLLANVAAERRPNSRLSCQLRVRPELEGMVVRLPERQS